MSRLGLKSKRRLSTEITSTQSNTSYQIMSSPTNKYFALFGHEKIYIFHTDSKNPTREIDYKAKYLLFDLQDEHILVTNSYELKQYSIINNASKMILSDEKKRNSISSLVYSPNHRDIFISNHSKMISMDTFTLKINLNLIKQPHSCPIDYTYVNQDSQQLITSSFDCNLCIFNIESSNKLTFLTKKSLQQCRIRQIVSIGDTLALTKNTITSIYPQILLLKPNNLQLIGSVIQNSTEMLINIVKVNNYILSFGINDNLFYIYQDNLRNKPEKIYLDSKIVNSAFNQLNNEIYIIKSDQNQENIYLEVYGIAFNCSIIKNQNISLPFEQNCSCEKGKIFSRSQFACKAINCQNTQCKCPYQQRFNSFSLQCQRDCSQIFDSFGIAPYGKENSCICAKPYLWNKQLSDCSFIDCSFINNTVSELEPGSSCKCVSNYEWNDTTLACQWRRTSNIASEASDSNVLPIVFGVLFLLLLIAVSGVIYYYKKYRKSPEDQPKTYQYPPRSTQRNFGGQTPRPVQSQVVIRDRYANSQIPMYALKSNPKV